MNKGTDVDFEDLDERIRRIRICVDVLETIATSADEAKDRINAARWLLEASGALNKHIQLRMHSRTQLWRIVRRALAPSGKLHGWLVSRGWQPPVSWGAGDDEDDGAWS